jgi:hypothetical protein
MPIAVQAKSGPRRKKISGQIMARQNFKDGPRAMSRAAL